MTLRHLLFLAHALLPLISAVSAEAQDTEGDLRRTVAQLDDSVFTAFNERDLERFVTFFSEDLEFYHDTEGASGYPGLVESSRRLFGQASPLRRELVEGSMEVHAVPGYGAIQIARHEFCHWANGAQDCGVFGFTHLWRLQGDQWQITRVFSYGH
jgi:hypothetical protein